MSTGAQVIVAALAGAVVLIRLTAALCEARTDGRMAAHRTRENRSRKPLPHITEFPI